MPSQSGGNVFEEATDYLLCVSWKKSSTLLQHLTVHISRIKLAGKRRVSLHACFSCFEVSIDMPYALLTSHVRVSISLETAFRVLAGPHPKVCRPAFRYGEQLNDPRRMYKSSDMTIVISTKWSVSRMSRLRKQMLNNSCIWKERFNFYHRCWFFSIWSIFLPFYWVRPGWFTPMSEAVAHAI